MKLSELQQLANKYNIEIVKDQNGRQKNKTKRELYFEISNQMNN